MIRSFNSCIYFKLFESQMIRINPQGSSGLVIGVGAERNQENQSHSSSNISINSRNRKRIPDTLVSALRRADKSEKSETQSRMGDMASGFNSFKNKLLKKLCEICDDEIQKPTQRKFRQVYMCDCEHKYNFCESCLHHYVIYKVKNFEEVNCAHDGCPKTLDMKTRFFKNLPADIQRNYKKINQFQMITKDPEAKLCPKENCDGVIRGSDNVFVCSECSNEYCGKCLLRAHRGDCDKQEVQFFQNNLHYRQCKKCKIIVEKIQGCNHITCFCKFQFCYVCGAPWTVEHYGNHDENGRLLAVPDFGGIIEEEAEEEEEGGAEEGCCGGCNCECNCCRNLDCECNRCRECQCCECNCCRDVHCCECNCCRDVRCECNCCRDVRCCECCRECNLSDCCASFRSFLLRFLLLTLYILGSLLLFACTELALPNYIGRNILLLYLYYLGIPSLFTFDMVFLPCGSDIWSIQGCQINFLGCCRAKTKVVLYKVQLGLKENRL